MKCYVCEFVGPTDQFGQLTTDVARIYGTLPPYPELKPVNVYVCPQCGALHSDMCGQILDHPRKP